MYVVDITPVIICSPKLAQAKLKVKVAPCPVSARPEGTNNKNINTHKNRRRPSHRYGVSAWRQRRSADKDHDQARRDPEG
jgi:hypothetical protein